MKNLWPIVLIILMWVLILFISIKYGKPEPKHINYETKYDSLQQQLQLERTVRTDLFSTVDSLRLLVDSLKNQSKQIEIRIKEVPGKYNKYNNKELENLMIEGYEQRD